MEHPIFKIIKKEELEDWKKTGFYYGSVKRKKIKQNYIQIKNKI